MLKIVQGIAHKNDKLRIPSNSYMGRCTVMLPRAKGGAQLVQSIAFILL